MKKIDLGPLGEKDIKMTEQEAELLADLDHPHIIGLEEFFIDS